MRKWRRTPRRSGPPTRSARPVASRRPARGPCVGILWVVRVLESRRTLAIYVAAGASFAALSARGLTVPLYAHELGADRFQVGALFSVATLAAALLSMPSGVLIDRFGTRTLLMLSIFVSAGSQVAMVFTASVAPLFLWQVVGGLGVGAQQAALFSAITALVPSGRLGRAMG